MNYLFNSVRKKLSLSSTSSSSGMRDTQHLSKSLDDIAYAPTVGSQENEMDFYGKFLGSEAVANKTGPEAAKVLESSIKSFQNNSKPKPLKIQIRVNENGVAFTTFRSKDDVAKSSYELHRVAYVSADFKYTCCACIICSSSQQASGWVCHAFLFAKPKYAKKFAIFLANHFDTAYDKWQLERERGGQQEPLEVSVELEAVKLKSQLNRGICNKGLVVDEDEENIEPVNERKSSNQIQQSCQVNVTKKIDKYNEPYPHNKPPVPAAPLPILNSCRRLKTSTGECSNMPSTSLPAHLLSNDDEFLHAHLQLQPESPSPSPSPPEPHLHFAANPFNDCSDDDVFRDSETLSLINPIDQLRIEKPNQETNPFNILHSHDHDSDFLIDL